MTQLLIVVLYLELCKRREGHLLGCMVPQIKADAYLTPKQNMRTKPAFNSCRHPPLLSTKKEDRRTAEQTQPHTTSTDMRHLHYNHQDSNDAPYRARSCVVCILNQLLEDGGALRIAHQDLSDTLSEVYLLPKVFRVAPTCSCCHR